MSHDLPLLPFFTSQQDNPERFFLAHRILARHAVTHGPGFWIRFTVQYNLFAGTVLAVGGEEQVASLDAMQVGEPSLQVPGTTHVHTYTQTYAHRYPPPPPHAHVSAHSLPTLSPFHHTRTHIGCWRAWMFCVDRAACWGAERAGRRDNGSVGRKDPRVCAQHSSRWREEELDLTGCHCGQGCGRGKPHGRREEGACVRAH
jgi:hypothetical protein